MTRDEIDKAFPPLLHELRAERDQFRQERDDAMAMLRCVLQDKPLPNGEYPHLLYCNGDRSQPPGTVGVSCCCLPHTRALAAEIAALRAKLNEWERWREMSVAMGYEAPPPPAPSRDPVTPHEKGD